MAPGDSETPSRGKKNKRADSSGTTPPSSKKEVKRTKSEMEKLDLIEGKLEILVGIKEKVDKMSEVRAMEDTVMTEKFDDLKQSIEFLSKSLLEIKSELKETKKDITHLHGMKEDIIVLRNQNQKLVQRITYMEDYQRRDNIVITGLAEINGENCREKCSQLFKECFNVEAELTRAHRLGPASVKNRKMIVRFKYFKDKEMIMSRRRVLKEKHAGVYIDDDYSVETLRRRNSLRPVVNLLKPLDERTHLRGDKIWYKGRLYSHNNIIQLPIDPHQACTATQGDVTLFSGIYSRLSNLYPVELIVDDRKWSVV